MRRTYRIEFQASFICCETDFYNGLKLYYLPIENRSQSIQHANLITNLPGEVISSCDEQDNPLLCFKPLAKSETLQITFSCEVQLKQKNQLRLSQSDLIDSKLFDFMPWQRVCLFEYTQPIELPEHILCKLHRHAMSLATQSNFDPIMTLRKLNKLAYQRPDKLIGYLRHTKVLPRDRSQQQLMLFVLLCRVLSIPTRYVRGYVKHFSLVKAYQFKIHLWAEVYLPYIGWIGFDPRYYRLANQNYIRCAVFAHPYHDGYTLGEQKMNEIKSDERKVEFSLSE